MGEIDRALLLTPRDCGVSGTLWDGKTPGAWIVRRFHIRLGVHQRQRLFRQRSFRLRKPHPLIAQADVELQQAYKENPEARRRSGH
jgi:hypothetical protein